MFALSFLRQTYYHKARALTVLHQSKITDWTDCATFPEAVQAIMEKASFRTAQTNKLETYGWTPTFFEPSTNERGELGVWRHGDHVADHLTLFIADLDNQHADRTMIRLEDVKSMLLDLGLSHLLYTSYSHTPDRHKVRIVCPVTRPITPDEAFEIFLWFNAAFDRQLDGSIYDPGDFIYGPPHGGQTVTHLDGAPIDVEALLEASRALPEADRLCVPRHRTERGGGAPTEAQRAHADTLWQTSSPSAEAVSIYNPAIFRPDWFLLLSGLYQEGSHRQTAMGLLSKVWIKSGCTLTRGDLQALQRELDIEMGGYLRRKYSSFDLDSDIRQIMRLVASPRPSRQTQIIEKIRKMQRKAS